MDAREFLGLEPVRGPGDDRTHWRLTVGPELSTPGKFLFGGCGLGAGLVALEAASGRPTVWATAQYLSYATTGSVVDYEVTLAVVGGHVTQGRAVARTEGREILTVNAALGEPQHVAHDVWVQPPSVPRPEECEARWLPVEATNSILDRVDVRVAAGRMMSELDGTAGERTSALWARVPGHLSPSAGTLAIFGDYVSGGASQPLGRPTMGRSLDNTLRMVQLEATEWVLCDIRMHAAVEGYAQGVAFLWSESGALLATASQSFGLRFWELDPSTTN
ncbi:MAG: acyl-CoA thioesterase [Acidimicrobiales bacterium]